LELSARSCCRPSAVGLPLVGIVCDRGGVPNGLHNHTQDQTQARNLAPDIDRDALPSKAPVFIGDHNETLMNVQDVLAEIVTQAQSYNIPMSTLKQHIARIHERIFENVKAACDAEPRKLEAACIWLANRTLKDIQSEPSAMPVGKIDALMNELIDK
jgi:hypothetical protein